MGLDHKRRRRPVHGVKIGNLGEPTIVFLTVCTKDRHPWLASDRCHQVLRAVWTHAEAWRVGRYVIMPDHVHLFAGWTGQAITLDAWVQYWKSQMTRQVQVQRWRWQAGHWDTRLRSADGYEEKWQYVLQNPVRKGLVADAKDWPYQGEVFPLAW